LFGGDLSHVRGRGARGVGDLGHAPRRRVGAGALVGRGLGHRLRPAGLDRGRRRLSALGLAPGVLLGRQQLARRHGEVQASQEVHVGRGLVRGRGWGWGRVRRGCGRGGLIHTVSW